MSAKTVQCFAPMRMHADQRMYRCKGSIQLKTGNGFRPGRHALRVRCPRIAQAVHPDAHPAGPTWFATDPSLRCMIAVVTLGQLWSRRAWALLRSSVLPVLISTIAVVATWAVACINQAIATTGQYRMDLASITASNSSIFDEFNRWAVYKMQKFFSQSILAKIAAVAAFAVPLVLIFGYWYRRTSGKSMDDSMFQVYSILQDTPGATACDEEDKKSGFVLNLVWVIGLFSYALVLGIVSDDVAQTAEGFKRGNTSIVESGHTLILNVNNTTEHMLRQWALAQRERGQSAPIVLLADLPKGDLDSMVENLKADTRMDIMARTGVPYNVDDLRLVSANQAKTVIIMDPENGNHDSESLVQSPSATLVSLAALGDSDARILLQLPCRDGPVAEYKRDILQSATHLHTSKDGQAKVTQVDALQSLRDAKTQCAVSPGVAGFYQDVFNHSVDSVEVYCRQFPQIDGMTFREVRQRFRDATPLGFSHAGTVEANPTEDAVLKEGDWIFGIASDKRAFSMSQPVNVKFEMTTRHTVVSDRGLDQAGFFSKGSAGKLDRHAPDARANHIIVGAFAEPSEDTLNCLGKSMPDNGSLTIICPDAVKMPPGKFRKRFIKGHPGTSALLRDAGIDTADSLLLAGMHDWGKSEADIQVLCSMAQLSDLMTTSPRRQPLHVVAEARGPLLEEFSERLKSLQKRRSATEHWQLLTTDVLPTEELVAGVIAQSGMQPEVSNVLRELFDVEDAAVTVRHPLKYMQYGETASLGELQERARQHGEIVLGVVDNSTNGIVMTNKQASIRHCDIKSIIVLSG